MGIAIFRLSPRFPGFRRLCAAIALVAGVAASGTTARSDEAPGAEPDSLACGIAFEAAYYVYAHSNGPHAVMELPFDPRRFGGLSEKLLRNHYETQYAGGVERWNAAEEQLLWPAASLSGAARHELEQAALSAATSVSLHEIYFASLGGGDGPPPDIAAALAAQFGSLERWRGEFVSTALAGGSGWMVLAYRQSDGRLINKAGAEAEQCDLDRVPILALDMAEHAYRLDFGNRAADYVDTFMRNIDWRRVAARLKRVSSAHQGD